MANVIHGVLVAMKLLAKTLEVRCSRHSFGDIFEVHVLESIQFPAQRDLKWSCDMEFTVTCNVSGDNWYKITLKLR